LLSVSEVLLAGCTDALLYGYLSTDDNGIRRLFPIMAGPARVPFSRASRRLIEDRNGNILESFGVFGLRNVVRLFFDKYVQQLACSELCFLEIF